MEEIERLRKQLREERRLREEEQRRREEAEERAGASQPLTLHQYLETCHSLSLAIEVVTDSSLTTQGGRGALNVVQQLIENSQSVIYMFLEISNTMLQGR
jgi:hypothetical protein